MNRGAAGQSMTENVLPLTTEAVDALVSPVAILDTSGVIVLVNRAWTRLAHGWPTARVADVGANYLAACHDAAGQGDAAAGTAAEGIQDVLQGRRENFSAECPGGGSGEDRWCHMAVTRLDVGPRRHVVVALDDISTWKRHERELEANRSLLRSVLEALPVGIWILDETGQVVHSNAAGQQIWGGVRHVGPRDWTTRWISAGSLTGSSVSATQSSS